jgi:YbgC/YbaW family acyl-CoA thioester hydrolase
VVLDSGTLRPMAPPDLIIDGLKMENPRIFPHQKFPQLLPQHEVAFVIQRTVEWQDLDSQEHVNNANYVAFAEEATVKALAAVGWSPSDFKSQGLFVVNKRVQIQYQSPALWGEMVDVTTYLLELNPTGGIWYIKIERISDREPIAQCTIEWSLANRNSGKEQSLPEDLYSHLKQRIALAENKK